MIDPDAERLVQQVRDAADRHGVAWGTLVPDARTYDASAEVLEETAFQEMAEAKSALRQHICDTYGISIAQLNSLATV